MSGTRTSLVSNEHLSTLLLERSSAIKTYSEFMDQHTYGVNRSGFLLFICLVEDNFHNVMHFTRSDVECTLKGE